MVRGISPYQLLTEREDTAPAVASRGGAEGRKEGNFFFPGRLPAATDGEALRGTAAVLAPTDAQMGKQALIVWTA